MRIFVVIILTFLSTFCFSQTLPTTPIYNYQLELAPDSNYLLISDERGVRRPIHVDTFTSKFGENGVFSAINNGDTISISSAEVIDKYLLTKNIENGDLSIGFDTAFFDIPGMFYFDGVGEKHLDTSNVLTVNGIINNFGTISPMMAVMNPNDNTQSILGIDNGFPAFGYQTLSGTTSVIFINQDGLYINNNQTPLDNPIVSGLPAGDYLWTVDHNGDRSGTDGWTHLDSIGGVDGNGIYSGSGETPGAVNVVNTESLSFSQDTVSNNLIFIDNQPTSPLMNAIQFWNTSPSNGIYSIAGATGNSYSIINGDWGLGISSNENVGIHSANAFIDADLGVNISSLSQDYKISDLPDLPNPLKVVTYDTTTERLYSTDASALIPTWELYNETYNGPGDGAVRLGDYNNLTTGTRIALETDEESIEMFASDLMEFNTAIANFSGRVTSGATVSQLDNANGILLITKEYFQSRKGVAFESVLGGASVTLDAGNEPMKKFDLDLTGVATSTVTFSNFWNDIANGYIGSYSIRVIVSGTSPTITFPPGTEDIDGTDLNANPITLTSTSLLTIDYDGTTYRINQNF